MRNSYNPVRRPAKAAPKPPAAARALALPLHSLRKALIGCAVIVLALGLFLGLGLGLMRAYQSITSSEVFAISDISVQGARQFPAESIIALSGLEKGQNSLRVAIPDVEKRLLSNPWVKQVTIRRELPGQFIIRVEEREPQFWVLRDGALYYLDASGALIAPVENQGFHSLPTLDIGPGGEESIALLSSFMEKLHTANLPFDPSQISWLRISAGKGFELYWESQHLQISIGSEAWQDNLRRLGLVIKDLEKRNEIKQTREIRAADGQVWLQKI